METIASIYIYYIGVGEIKLFFICQVQCWKSEKMFLFYLYYIEKNFIKYICNLIFWLKILEKQIKHQLYFCFFRFSEKKDMRVKNLYHAHIGTLIKSIPPSSVCHHIAAPKVTQKMEISKKVIWQKWQYGYGVAPGLPSKSAMWQACMRDTAPILSVCQWIDRL